MANMFYTIEEAASKLGLSTDEVQAMISSGELSSHDDDGKTMLKSTDVDAKASEAQTDTISLTDFSDEMDPNADSASATIADDNNTDNNVLDASEGVSIFDDEDVDDTDSMAMTQVTSSPLDDEDLALESVGSGSGLLDLTRESDDTSLGAELLDEIYPSEGTDDTGDIKMDTAAVGATGIFDTSVQNQANELSGDGDASIGETFADSFSDGGDSFGSDSIFDTKADDSETSSPSFTADANESSFAVDEPTTDFSAAPAARAITSAQAEIIEYDPVGSNAVSAILAFGALIPLVLTIFAMAPFMFAKADSPLNNMLINSANNEIVDRNGLLYMVIGCLFLAIVMMVIGILFGKRAENK